MSRKPRSKRSTPRARPAARPPALRLARWLGVNEKRLVTAGAGAETAGERRLLQNLLAEVKVRLGARVRAAARGRSRGTTDPVTHALLIGALRDRAITLLGDLPAREAATLRRQAGRVFNSLLSGSLSPALSAARGHAEARSRLRPPARDNDEELTRLLLERVFEDSEQAVLVYDRAGAVLHANGAAARWYGYPERAIRGMNVTEFIAPPYRDQFRSLLRNLLRKKHSVIEATHVRRDGSRFNLEVSSWVLRGGKRPWMVSIQRDVTERRRTENALDLVLTGARCFIWQAVVDSPGGSARWAPATLDDVAAQAFLPLRLRRGESYGQAFLRCRMNPDGESAGAALAEAIRKGEPSYSREFACLDVSGESRWIHEDVRLEPIGQGRWRLTGLCTDLTSRRNAEEVVRENAQRFQKVFDEGPLGMALVDPDFAFLRINDTFCRMLGYSETDLLGRRFAHITHPDEIDTNVNQVRRLFSGEIPSYATEKRYLKKNGEVLWANLTSSVIRDSAGKPLYGLAMVEDISERRRASAELERRVKERTHDLTEIHRRNETILRTAIDGYFVLDAKGRFIEVNDAYCAMSGYARNEILCMGLGEIEVIASEKAITRNLRRIRRDGGDRFETRHRRKDGSQINIEISVNYLPDDGGGRFIVFARDITSRKEDLKALAESELRFRTIFEYAPILVDGFTKDGQCVLWNKECERMLGWTHQEIMESDDPLGLVYPDPEIRRQVAKKIRRADGRFREFEVRAKDGSARVQMWADFRLPSGSIISTGLDITDRKKAENELRDARDGLERRVEDRTSELRRAIAALEKEVEVRQLAEGGLRDSEAKLSALIENASEAIWSIDTRQRIIAFNSFFREQFQLAFGVAPATGKTMEDLLTAPHLAGARDFLMAQLNRTLSGESFTVDTAYLLSGEKHYYTVSLHPIVAGGVIRGATIYSKDVTERKLAEKALAYQAGFEKLIANISQTFLSVSPENLDQAIQEMLRSTGEFAQADRSRLFLNARDSTILKSVYEWCAEGVESQVHRVRRMPPDFVLRLARELRKSGILAITRISDLPPGDEPLAREFERQGIRSLVAVPLLSKGAQIGVLGFHAVRKEREWSEETIRLVHIVGEIAANTIERTRAQRDLMDLSRQHELILDSAGEGIFGLDAAGSATFVNPAASRMLGWPPDEIVGALIHPLFHHTRPDGLPCLAEECPILSVFDDGAVQNVSDCVFWRKDRTSFPVEFISTPIREEGRIVGAVVTFMDITERKRGEEALRRVVEGTSSTLGEGFFRSLVEHLGAALGIRFAFVSELMDARGGRVRLLAIWEGADFGDCFEYAVHETPCERVFLDGRAVYRSGVRNLFPEDVWLHEVGAESYLAVPLYDAKGSPIGHLGVMDNAPIENEAAMEPILQIFAARAGAELERKRAEEALARQLELEKIIGAVSKRFVTLEPESISAAIDDALELVGTHAGVDRAYLFGFSEDLAIIDCTNEWCGEGIPPRMRLIRNRRTGYFPWAMEKLKRGDTIYFEQLDELPDDAALEKAGYMLEGIKSLVCVPVVYRNSLMGFVGFDTVGAEKRWTEQTRRYLEIFAEILANALARHRAETELKELSHRNQLILDAAGEGIFGLDLEGKTTFVNPSAARMLGWEAGEIIGRSVHAVVHGGGRGQASHGPDSCPIEASPRAAAVHRVEEDFFRRKDGSAFPVECICTPVLEEGRIIGAVVTFNDITPRKRAEELRYHAHLLSQVPDAVLVIDEGGRIGFWSTGAESLTGYSSQDVVGGSLGLLLAEGDPGGGLPAILHRIAGGGSGEDYQGEHLVQRKDGQSRLIAIHLSPSPDPDGEGHNWIGVAQDVTEVRSLQEEIIQAQRLAEVGTLAAGVAHEINNPLTVLSGNIQSMLERAGPDDPDRARYEQMKRVSDRIGEVVNGLSRISAPHREQWALTNPNEVVEETLMLVEQLHGRERVRIHRRYTEDLPKLRLLQNGLQQFLLNMVMNAMDAIEGDGKIIVETRHGAESFAPRLGALSALKPAAEGGAPGLPSVTIRISDTGCGIPKENLSRIFLPFFSTKEPGKGTGLGLAVARSIVSIHRGSIEVESEVGRGTTFTVTLPAS